MQLNLKLTRKWQSFKLLYGCNASDASAPTHPGCQCHYVTSVCDNSDGSLRRVTARVRGDMEHLKVCAASHKGIDTVDRTR
jgi:hypothetical protein